MGISSHRQSAQTPAVEGMPHGNDLMVCILILQPGIFSCHFDGTLNGFCAAVGKKSLVKAGCLCKLLGCLHHGEIVIQIGCVDHFVYLVFQCLIVCRMVVSQSKDRNTCCKIQVFFSIHIIKADTVPFFQDNRKTVIGVENHMLRPLHIFVTIRLHDNTFPRLS